MKKLFICLLALGLFNLATAQNNGNVKPISLENITIKPLNLSYINKVQDKDTPPFAKALEDQAARYDITESPTFGPDFEAYEVVFKTIKQNGANGTIIATYDQDGKILNSVERYKNVSLPKAIAEVCLKEYPGYSIHKDFYLVTYNFNKNKANKIYKVQMKNGNSKKNLKVDASGNIQ